MNQEEIYKAFDGEYFTLHADGSYALHLTPEQSEWKCYMFGNKPEINDGITVNPKKGCEPKWFVRWMMKVCFDCTWIKEKND